MNFRENYMRKPSSLRIKLPGGEGYRRVKEIVEGRRITPSVRSAAHYDRRLQVLKWIAESGLGTKSGI